MSVTAEVDEDGCISATITYPDDSKNRRQLPLMEDDGDDTTIRRIKEMLFQNQCPGYSPNDYNLVLVNGPGRFIANDNEALVTYFDQIFRERYQIIFERRN